MAASPSTNGSAASGSSTVSSTVDNAVRNPDLPSRIRPEYDGGDHLYFNAVGYRAMADAAPLAELALPCCGR